MAYVQSDRKPQPGDLIEIFRGQYQHWGIYVGKGYIIHLAPPCEHANAGANSLMSVLNDKAVVKKEKLHYVAGDDEYTINNLLDEQYEPRPVDDILEEAYDLIGMELPYCVIRGNCEHFVTELRYGKAESRQVRRVVKAVGLTTLFLVGALAVGALLSSSEDKEKRKNTQRN